VATVTIEQLAWWLSRFDDRTLAYLGWCFFGTGDAEAVGENRTRLAQRAA